MGNLLTLRPMAFTTRDVRSSPRRRAWLVLAASAVLAACGVPEVRYPSGGAAECPRGGPRPVLSSASPDVLSASFTRVSPSRAVETARLRGNIRLTVRHTRCRSIAYVFVFELRERPRPVRDRGYWYERAAGLLETASQRNPEGDGLRVIARRLRTAAASASGGPPGPAAAREAGRAGAGGSAPAPAYGTPLPMDGYQTVSLGVRKGNKGRGARIDIRCALER
ncbi:MAG: hypothetical protein ABII00_12100 [Elusimicrobiota bacterium]